MKKRNWLFGFLLGICITGALAFIYMPLLIKHPSFLSGFMACAVFALFALAPLLIWSRPTKSTPLPYLRALVLLFFIMAGLLIAFMLFRKDDRIITQVKMQRIQLARQTEWIETSRNNGLVTWMSQILQQANDELAQNPQRSLRDETIATIAALSYSFKPYLRYEGDTVIPKLLSPERGMLLLALTRMNMDSGSMQKILLQSHFANAELRDADLRHAFLKNADLHEADLARANLDSANLQDADLWSANLWGAKLRGVKLNRAVLQRADMSWADLKEADLQEADLNGAKLNSALLRKADLRKATLQWTDARGAFLNEANLAGADMYGTSLQRTHLVSTDLSQANLKQANMIEANLTEANFTGADLTRTVVLEPDWISLLTAKRVIGAAEIQNLYHLVNESVGDKIEYCLEKK